MIWYSLKKRQKTMGKRIDQERLAVLFRELASTDSPSREEGAVAAKVKKFFSRLEGTRILEDDTRPVTGSQ